MKRSLTLIITLITGFFILISPYAFGYEKVNVSQATKLINFSTIPKSYAFYNANYGDSLYQVNFMNSTSKQRVSFTFSKLMPAKKGAELKTMVEVVLKASATEKSGDVQNKITSFKKFFAHNQVIYYYNVDELKNNKLWTKAIMSFLGDYNGKCMIMQSYGPPETFNEKEAIDFFSNVQFYTSNF